MSLPCMCRYLDNLTCIWIKNLVLTSLLIWISLSGWAYLGNLIWMALSGQPYLDNNLIWTSALSLDELSSWKAKRSSKAYYSPCTTIRIFHILVWDLKFLPLIRIVRPQLCQHPYFSLMTGPQTHHQQVEILWSTVIQVHWILRLLQVVDLHVDLDLDRYL